MIYYEGNTITGALEDKNLIFYQLIFEHLKILGYIAI